MPRCDVVEWKRALRDQRELSAHQVAAALALTLWMHRDGFIGEPPVSIATVAAVLARKRANVSDAVSELVELGWLKRQERPGRTSYLWAAVPDIVLASWPQLGEPVPQGNTLPVPPGDRVETVPVPPGDRVVMQGVPPGDRVPVPPGDRVGGNKRSPVPPEARDLSRQGTPKSYPGLYTLPPNVLGTADLPPNEKVVAEMRMATPETEPELWAQAQAELDRLPAGTVQNPPAYRKAIFRRLVDEKHQAQHRTAITLALDECPLCTTAGMVYVIGQDGSERVERCNHQTRPDLACLTCSSAGTPTPLAECPHG